MRKLRHEQRKVGTRRLNSDTKMKIGIYFHRTGHEHRLAGEIVKVKTFTLKHKE